MCRSLAIRRLVGQDRWFPAENRKFIHFRTCIYDCCCIFHLRTFCYHERVSVHQSPHRSRPPAVNITLQDLHREACEPLCRHPRRLFLLMVDLRPPRHAHASVRACVCCSARRPNSDHRCCHCCHCWCYMTLLHRRGPTVTWWLILEERESPLRRKSSLNSCSVSSRWRQVNAQSSLYLSLYMHIYIYIPLPLPPPPLSLSLSLIMLP